MRLIFDALTRHAAAQPHATAFRNGADRISWQDLATRVSRAARGFATGPEVVALALDGIDYVIGDLSATLAGRRVVPVPQFFSDGQRDHLLRQSAATLVTSLPFGQDGPTALEYPGGAERVIYTSGTTGTPKGVVLGDRQITASVTGLAAAIRPVATDRYLSALPQAQLLEQICGIFLPVLAGVETVLCPEGVAALFGGSGPAFAQATEAAAPTVTVLAPRQLALWVAAIRAGVAQVPTGLRYVAVGGAPVAPSLLAEARALGIPACAGYGLSEACSVVALAQPDDAPDGSAGRPIDGLSVHVEDGQIVVSGPTVMQGYLGTATATAEWHTGDKGRIEDGKLWVEGRQDAVIVRSNGRNVAPEWVEAEALADPRVIAAALVPADHDLVLLIAPAAPPDLAALLMRLQSLPPYARPDHLLIADPRTTGLIRASGTADRALAAQIVQAARHNWQPLGAQDPDKRKTA